MASVGKLKLGLHWTIQQDNDPKFLKFHQGLVAEEVLEDSTEASQWFDLNPMENLWWDLKKAVEARKPKKNDGHNI